MQVQPAPPAPSTPAVSSTPTSVQIPTAQAASTSPAVPAHIVQAAPPEQTPMPASPAPGVTTPKTAPPVAPATTPPIADPPHDVTYDTAVDDTPTPALIDTEAEAKLSSEIVELWVKHKDGKTAARRTRAELKTLKLLLAKKLHRMKKLLVGTGRDGDWASFLRAQHLPVSSADRYVAQHEKTLAPPDEKLLTEELSVEEVCKLAHKGLAKLCRVLTTQELVYAYVRELVWNIDVAEASYTDLGIEIPKVGSNDAPETEAPVAELAESAPAAA